MYGSHVAAAVVYKVYSGWQEHQGCVMRAQQFIRQIISIVL